MNSWFLYKMKYLEDFQKSNWERCMNRFNSIFNWLFSIMKILKLLLFGHLKKARWSSENGV